MLRLMLGLLHPQEGERILIGETDGEKIAVDPSARRLFFLCAAGEYHVFGNNRGKYEKCKTGSLG